MMRDVLVASMNKGQFPLALFAIFMLVWLWRLPQEVLSELTLRALTSAGIYHVGGYVMTILLALGWFFHSKHQRRSTTAEISRLSTERSDLQQQLLDLKALPSSNRS